MSACGRTAFVSDEYGPFIYEFDLLTGQRNGVVSLPNKFLIAFPSADGNVELEQTSPGAKPTVGWRGSRSHRRDAALRDHAERPHPGQRPGCQPEAVGTNNRIVEINLETGAIREFL